MKNRIVHITKNSGLILEGGGMRGIFTNGVLDNFMDRGIMFPYIIGVSAGACNALSYVSNQRGRAKYADIDLLKEYDYKGKGGDVGEATDAQLMVELTAKLLNL